MLPQVGKNVLEQILTGISMYHGMVSNVYFSKRRNSDLHPYLLNNIVKIINEYQSDKYCSECLP